MASGRTSISGGAQNKNGVNLYIDGVGQKGYVRSGVSGQAGDTQGNPFPQLAIGEYKVITSNYKAEYDQISSAAITALTRSGTNKFEGQAFGTYTADNFRAQTPGEHAAGMQDRIGEQGIRPRVRRPDHPGPHALLLDLRSQALRDADHGATGRQRPADIVAATAGRTRCAQLGPAAIAFEEDLFFAKTRLGADRRDRFEFSAKIRDEVSDGDQTGTGVAASAAVDTDNDDKRCELSWKHSADRLAQRSAAHLRRCVLRAARRQRPT